jgi:SAM-dependent methyltransferase
VSLIMCVWRPRPDWFMQAVESALGQRDCRIELIVVDDGSPEPVADLLQHVADDRLRLVRIEHAGLSGARNAGIAAARGSQLRFIDGDDVLDPDSTARLLRLMGGDDAVITYGATMFCDADLRPQRKRTCRLTGSATTPCLLGGFDVRIQALLFPRRIVEAAGEWNTAIPVCQDWDFTLRALEHGRVRGEDHVEVYYRRHAGSNSSNAAAVRHGVLQVVDGYVARHPEVRGTRLETRIQAMLDVLEAGWSTAGRPWKSGRFWRGVVADPGAALPALQRYLPDAGRGLLRSAARRTLPAPIYRWVNARRHGQVYCPPPGWVRFGSLRRITPLSRVFGKDRGLPIDRFYVERFLASRRADIRGSVLEIGSNAYTRRYGGSAVTNSDVLDVRGDNPQATVVADLTRADNLPSNLYDCVILTQTLQFIYDVAAALRTVHRILRPGGVLLATFGGISQISRWEADRWGHFWNFTTWSARRLLEEVFPAANVSIEAHGNVLAAIAFLHGMATSELKGRELEHRDPDYEVLITVRAVKPDASA